MKQFTSISGFVVLELTGADIPSFLRALAEKGIHLFRIQQKNLLTAYIWVRRGDQGKIDLLAEKRGAAVRLVQRQGLYWLLLSLLRRPVIVTGIGLILLLSWFLPTRVLFVTVEGNSNIPDNRILEKAAECGITFGANRRVIRSEKVKNSLLEALPELKWTGVNTYGCTAVISVQERSQNEAPLNSHGVSSIVANRDGIIYSSTIFSGNSLCAEGQAVRAGEVLVSGYRNCGIKIQATRSKAEIFAQTERLLTVKSPLDYTRKGDIYRSEKKYSLILGKKRINFYKDSGISPTSCDKMYLQYYCVLPGGFQLPISIVLEQRYYYSADNAIVASDATRVCAEDFAQDYLFGQMLSGKILAKAESETLADDVYTLTGRYVCLEMIGRERYEEIIKYDGKSD